MKNDLKAPELVARIQSMLAGADPDVQGDALAELGAQWLSGYQVSEDEKMKTLSHHCALVWELMKKYEQTTT